MADNPISTPICRKYLQWYSMDQRLFRGYSMNGKIPKEFFKDRNLLKRIIWTERFLINLDKQQPVRLSYNGKSTHFNIILRWAPFFIILCKNAIRVGFYEVFFWIHGTALIVLRRILYLQGVSWGYIFLKRFL